MQEEGSNDLAQLLPEGPQRHQEQESTGEAGPLPDLLLEPARACHRVTPVAYVPVSWSVLLYGHCPCLVVNSTALHSIVSKVDNEL